MLATASSILADRAASMVETARSPGHLRALDDVAALDRAQLQMRCGARSRLRPIRSGANRAEVSLTAAGGVRASAPVRLAARAHTVRSPCAHAAERQLSQKASSARTSLGRVHRQLRPRVTCRGRLLGGILAGLRRTM